MAQRRRGRDDAPWQADLFRALGEPKRLRTVFRLFQGPATVGELATALGAEQSLVSHHLAALRRSGLVTARREGRRVSYDLSPGVRGALEGCSLDLGCCVVTFRRPPPEKKLARRRRVRRARVRR